MLNGFVQIEIWAGPLMIFSMIKVKYTCITLAFTLHLLNLCNGFAHFEFGTIHCSLRDFKIKSKI
jgi:hypothetical protein